MDKHPTIAKIDSVLEADQEDGRRGHLGGSMIGRSCEREGYYSFRWASKSKHKDEHTGEEKPGHSGRTLRLFNRGHLEEFRFVEWLQDAGMDVLEYDIQQHLLVGADGHNMITVASAHIDKYFEDGSTWIDVTTDTTWQGIALARGVKFKPPKQFRIKDVDGHFGGSLDGKLRYVPGIEALGLPGDIWVLGEFKTHGLKSFDKLAGKRPRWDEARRGGEGVKKAKPEHYSQMQIYMHKSGLKVALYMAICKNDDDLYFEFVMYDQLHAIGLLGKAKDIIYATEPPDRLSASPSWWECTFCDYKRVCHHGDAWEKSCRGCVSSQPAADGEWYCNRFESMIPFEHQLEGCDMYQQLTE